MAKNSEELIIEEDLLIQSTKSLFKRTIQEEIAYHFGCELLPGNFRYGKDTRKSKGFWIIDSDLG
ncbi:hypothetical protein [Leptospira noguchii]|uniref:Uncharacterized protein n=1 Tax=Leptospira noguchii serovar Panama str. CZ214 TaxID=1001595 RepID=T0GMA8_9LEPT|nr:hypothetical protein [Leptospira noguchii]EQA70022.1 hypothetical protein LEP1GSC059_1863 [Leptospira noguchii serovar Panama str. CZ214]